MLEILIVDDNAEKISVLQQFINENLNGECKITVKTNTQCARQSMIENVFDLMVLDVQFPEFENAPVRSDAGISFLKEILSDSPRTKRRERSRPRRPSSIIVLSEYKDSILEYHGNFSDSIFKIAQYDGFTDTWCGPLLQSLEHAYALRKVALSKTLEYDFDVGIICALDKELDHILKLNFNWSIKRLHHDLNIFFHTADIEINDRKVKIVCSTPNKLGMTDTTIASMKMIDNFKPKYIFMTGIIGGIKSKVKEGDILVADPCYSHESGKYTEGIDQSTEFQPTSTHVNSSAGLKSLLHELSLDKNILKKIYDSYLDKKPESSPTIHIGPVSSGNAVIANGRVLQGIIKNERNLLGVDMEVYGLYRSCFLAPYPKPEFLAFKAVSDYADSGKSDEYQDYCSFLTSNILEHLINNMLFENDVV